MLKKLVPVLAVPLLALATAAALLVVALRTKSPRLLGAVRRVNRACWNPMAMKSAGQPGAQVSVIRHVGRTTGAAHETPVGAQPTPEGFVIALPYGLQADWVKNVLASGSATIVHDGTEYPVGRPQVVPIAPLAEVFPPSDRRGFQLMRVEQALELHRLPTGVVQLVPSP